MAFGERGIGIGAGELICPWGMALCILKYVSGAQPNNKHKEEIERAKI
jgi:hypothetical protein